MSTQPDTRPTTPATEPRDPCDWTGWTPLCRVHGSRAASPAALDVEAFAFPRNVLISNDHGFMGRWVAIPREDFDRARAEYARLTAEQEQGDD